MLSPRLFAVGVTAAALLVPWQQSVYGQTPSRTTANLTAARTAMAHGVSAVRDGDLTGAKRDFSTVVRLAPRVEPGHAALGSVLLTLHEFEAAVRELQIARQLAPDDFAAALNLGRAHAALGQYQDAVTAFRAGVAAAGTASISPDETLAYARALSGTGDLPAAVDLLQQGVDATPEAAQLQDGLGTALAQQGRLEMALPHFERAVTLDPMLGIAQLHASAAMLALGRPAEAVPYAEKAVATTPDSFDGQLQLGQALSAVHRDTEALTHLRRAAELRTNVQTPDALYSLALALQASGDAAGSLPLFAAATADPQEKTSFAHGSALINYALARVLTGDAAGALPLYARALVIGPDSATLREDFGAAYLQKADLDHAIEQFKAGLAIEPENAHLHYDLGLAYKLKDNLVDAVPEFERAAALDANLPDPAYTLGIIYMQQGKYPEAITNLKRATALRPENGDAWALLGGVLKDSGDATGATDALHHAVLLQPDQPSLHIQLATLEAQAGRGAEAAAERKAAAELSRAAMNRQRAEFALKSGRTLLEQNKLSDAVVQLTNAAHAEPKLAEPHRLLAEAYTRQGKTADAAVERQQADALAVTGRP